MLLQLERGACDSVSPDIQISFALAPLCFHHCSLSFASECCLLQPPFGLAFRGCFPSSPSPFSFKARVSRSIAHMYTAVAVYCSRHLLEPDVNLQCIIICTILRLR